MKKYFFKSLAVLILALSIIFSLAACSDGEQKDPQTNNQPADAVQTADDITEFVNVYNAALEKSSVKCISSSQKVEKGNLWIGDNSDETMDLTAPEQSELLAKFEKNETFGTELTPLNAADVKSVNVNENVVTFTLKSANTTGSAAQGQNGYLNIIDTDGTQVLVDGVKSYANVKGNVKINSSEYGFSQGSLTVTFNNKKHKNIEAVSFSGRQSVRAEMKYLVITINADINYVLSSEYAKV